MENTKENIKENTNSETRSNSVISFVKRHPLMVLLFIGILLIIGWIISVLVGYSRQNDYEGLTAEAGFPMSNYDSNNFYTDKYGFLDYKGNDMNTRRGIDVSEYQDEIDWKKVKAAGVDFAMIRLGYSGYVAGEIVTDEYFEKNIKGATEAGIDVGVYFFSQAVTVDEAIEEANFVLDNIENVEVEMPIAFDMEYVTETEDRIYALNMYEKTEIADAFCSIIENNGYRPVIYGNPSWIYKSLNLSLIPHREIWLAHYTNRTDFPYEYCMWQYSSSGVVDGIDTQCDLNIYLEKAND